MTIAEIRAHLADGSMTTRQIVDGYLERIEKEDHAIGAFLEVFAADARLEADHQDAARARGEELGPLAGIPVAIKDNILMEGKTATAGSLMLEHYTAPYSATVVERLKKAGAILIGRTNCDEFACGSSTQTSAYGVTKNPIDKERVPGGSSGGSAAAVAAGFVPVALGSDTGGSIRQPAALCGTVGFKPTYGHVSRYGLIAYASSLDQIGAFAMNVADTAEVMRVIAGQDAQDATTVATELAFPEFSGDVKGLRIGVPKQFFDDNLDPELLSRVHEAIAVYEQAGATVTNVDIPILQQCLALYYVIAPAELSSNLHRYDGLQFGQTQAGKTLEEQVKATRAYGFGAEVKRRALLGTYVLSAGHVDAYYKKATRARALLKDQLDVVFDSVDVLMGPTSPVVAWKLGDKMDDPLTMYLADIYTVSANLAGIPGLSIPCGTIGGLPVGLQLLGQRGSDAKLLDLGHWYQQQSL